MFIKPWLVTISAFIVSILIKYLVLQLLLFALDQASTIWSHGTGYLVMGFTGAFAVFFEEVLLWPLMLTLLLKGASSLFHTPIKQAMEAFIINLVLLPAIYWPAMGLVQRYFNLPKLIFFEPPYFLVMLMTGIVFCVVARLLFFKPKISPTLAITDQANKTT